MTVRRRQLPGLRGEATRTTTWENFAFGTSGTDPTLSNRIEYPGTQMTESEGHPFRSTKTKGLQDLGGDFFTQKRYIAAGQKNNVDVAWSEPNSAGNGVLHKRQKSLILAALPVSAGALEWPPTGTSSDEELNALGATAIARCAPANPPSNVVSALGELLKDGLPSLVGSQLWKDRTAFVRDQRKLAKSAGSEYLNEQFGWAPLVNDVTTFARTVASAHQILDQLERDAGKVVRRRYNFPIQRQSEEMVYRPSTVAYMPVDMVSTPFFNGRLGDVVRTRVTERRQWFSGSFTYWLPRGYESRIALIRLAARAEELFGVNLSPDTLWELTPWSWAADWFSNAGDVIHNVSRFASQGLVMQYGYMMEHTKVSDTYTLSSTGYNAPLDSVPPLTLVTETKVRRRANPFGFGLSWNGLSTFQTSILAALGITRR